MIYMKYIFIFCLIIGETWCELRLQVTGGVATHLGVWHFQREGIQIPHSLQRAFSHGNLHDCCAGPFSFQVEEKFVLAK